MPTLEYNKEEGTVTISNLEGTFTCGILNNIIDKYWKTCYIICRLYNVIEITHDDTKKRPSVVTLGLLLYLLNSL